MLVCINRNAYALDAFLANGSLCVNVLTHEHRDLSRAFARWTGEDRFARATWATLATGAPVLEGAAVAFDCRIADSQHCGTHTVLFCQVQETQVSNQANGLIWFDRSFHELGAA